MLFVYDSKMPLRIMEEIRYWKMEEKEHAQLIRQLVPHLEKEYKTLLQEWEQAFKQTEESANRWIQILINQESQRTREYADQLETFVRVSVQQSQQFVQHMQRMQGESANMLQNESGRIGTLHAIRESEFFIGVMNALLASDRSPFRHEKVTVSSTGTDLRQAEQSNATEHKGKPVPIGGHKLPPLPYPYDALEPHIDAQTMKLHHDIHHQSYVTGLNEAEKMMQTARETNDFTLLKHWEREAAFHGAGHYLHTIFWHVMSPSGGGKATGAIAAQIDRDFGSFDRFKAHFSQAAEKVEGGGWAILVWSPRSHRLEILQAEKHQNLSQWDVIPLLVLDVWEHAYYLKYKNERKKYIQAWWNTVNWDHVNERFIAARRLQWMPY